MALDGRAQELQATWHMVPWVHIQVPSRVQDGSPRAQPRWYLAQLRRSQKLSQPNEPNNWPGLSLWPYLPLWSCPCPALQPNLPSYSSLNPPFLPVSVLVFVLCPQSGILPSPQPTCRNFQTKSQARFTRKYFLLYFNCKRNGCIVKKILS